MLCSYCSFNLHFLNAYLECLFYVNWPIRHLLCQVSVQAFCPLVLFFFCWSVYVFFCLYYTILLLWLYYLYLNFSKCPPTLFFKIFLPIINHLNFHISFRSSLTVSIHTQKEKPAEVLIKISVILDHFGENWYPNDIESYTLFPQYFSLLYFSSVLYCLFFFRFIPRYLVFWNGILKIFIV